MKLRVISDVHVELYKTPYELVKDLDTYLPKNDKSSEILILAGDIGIATLNGKIHPSYYLILEYFRSRWQHIILVPGNHEYYHCSVSYEKVDEILKNTCEELDIHYLNKGVLQMFGYTFLGCCLWSKINDYSYDNLNSSLKRLLTKDEFINEHRKHRNWIIEECYKRHRKEKLIIITHYVPTYKLIDKKYLTPNYLPTASAYVTELQDIIKAFSHCISYWICGHSHMGKYAIIDTTFCFLNPFGNPTQDPTMYRGTLDLE